MRIVGTDIYVAYEDSFDLTLNLSEDYEDIIMKFSFDLKSITKGVNDKIVTFSINSDHTTEKPGEYYYEVIGKKGDEQTTLIKKSLFVIEETARYAAKMTTTTFK